MEFSKHNWATLSETIFPEMLIFGKQASWTLFFQHVLTNKFHFCDVTFCTLSRGVSPFQLTQCTRVNNILRKFVLYIFAHGKKFDQQIAGQLKTKSAVKLLLSTTSFFDRGKGDCYLPIFTFLDCLSFETKCLPTLTRFLLKLRWKYYRFWTRKAFAMFPRLARDGTILFTTRIFCG